MNVMAGWFKSRFGFCRGVKARLGTELIWNSSDDGLQLLLDHIEVSAKVGLDWDVRATITVIAGRYQGSVRP